MIRRPEGTLLATLNLLLILHVESFLHNNGWSSCVFLFLREFSPGSDHSLSWGGIFLQRDLDRNQSFPQTSNLFQLRATRELIRLARQTSKKKTQNSTLDSMLIYNQPDPVWRNMKLYNLICLSSFTLISSRMCYNCCYLLNTQISSIMAHNFTTCLFLHALHLSRYLQFFYIQFYQQKTNSAHEFLRIPTSTHK